MLTLKLNHFSERGQGVLPRLDILLHRDSSYIYPRQRAAHNDNDNSNNSNNDSDSGSDRDRDRDRECDRDRDSDSDSDSDRTDELTRLWRAGAVSTAEGLLRWSVGGAADVVWYWVRAKTGNELICLVWHSSWVAVDRAANGLMWHSSGPAGVMSAACGWVARHWLLYGAGDCCKSLQWLPFILCRYKIGSSLGDLGGSVIRSQLLFPVSFVMHNSVFKTFAAMIGKASQMGCLYRSYLKQSSSCWLMEVLSTLILGAYMSRSKWSWLHSKYFTCSGVSLGWLNNWWWW